MESTPHPLAEWIARQPLTVDQCAAAIGIHRVSLHRYASGRRMPRLDVCAAIARATNNEITVAVLATHYRGGA
jgi:hypothetical protein